MPRAGAPGSNEAAWIDDARQHGDAHRLGVRDEGARDSPGRTWRMRASLALFGIGWGLTLWQQGYGPAMVSGWEDVVIGGYVVAYVALFAVVVWQFRKDEILPFGRADLEGGELACCGIKWSTLFGYIFALFTAAVIIFLPFWVTGYITECEAKSGDARHECYRDKIGRSGIIVSAVFAVLAFVFGVREIVKHWLNYYNVRMQRHIVRVLIMVPIYALDAFFTLWLCFGRTNDDGSRVGCMGDDNYEFRLALETIRELYEAYTIYSFFTYLVECLHDKAVREDAAAEDRSAEGERQRMAAAGQRAPAPEPLPAASSESINAPLLPAGQATRQSIVSALGLAHEDKMYACLRRHNPDGQPHPWWSGVKCCMDEWTMGEVWLKKCWSGVLAYVVVEVAFAIVLLITRLAGVYGEGCLFPWSECTGQHDGELGYQNAYTYLTFIVSVAQMYALYCLWMFYHATQVPLAEIKPGAKFISIKAIVFLTYWQGIALGFFQEWFGLDPLAIFVGLCDEADPDSDFWDGSCEDAEGAESLSTGMQAVLICLEMFGASLVHRTVFSYKDYKLRSTDEPQMGFCEAVKHSFNPQTVVQQATHYVHQEVPGVAVVAGGAGAVVGAFEQVAEAVSDRYHGGDRMLGDEGNDSQRLRV